MIDFEHLIQYQRHRNSRKRKIKRDLETANKKGVAGLEIQKKEANIAPQPSASSGASASTSCDRTSSGIGAMDNDEISMQVEPNCQSNFRQIPLGSDHEILENSTNVNSVSNAGPTPDLVRAASDATTMSMQNSVTPLFRSNTYSHADRTGDSLME